jgi:hypothetical protein
MKTKLFLLFLGMSLAFAACSNLDDEPAPQDTATQLINKKWYMTGKNGQHWVLYKGDGSWNSHSGDDGNWSLVNGKVLKITATQDLLGSWEEDILELTGNYLKTKVKGTTIPKEYSTTP